MVLLAAEDQRPYERPPLSNEYLQGAAERDSVYVQPADWYGDHDVDLRLDTMVSAIDRAASEVVLAGRVAVLGGGWIGLEVAAACRIAGVEVTVLEAAPAPLLAALGPEIAAVFADLHREHGVDLRLGVQVAEIVGQGGVAAGVRLADGGMVEADVVVVGIGAVPNTDLARDADLVVDDGVVVDDHLRSIDRALQRSRGGAGHARPRGSGHRLRPAALTSSPTSTTSGWSTPVTPRRAIPRTPSTW